MSVIIRCNRCNGELTATSGGYYCALCNMTYLPGQNMTPPKLPVPEQTADELMIALLVEIRDLLREALSNDDASLPTKLGND